MATTVRSFLMVRGKNGDWSVSVHHDLEGLLTVWRDRRNSDEVVGVLHVGFDRPPSREFEEVAAGYSGRMRLTAAARFGLPTGFQTSNVEIGRVGGVPIYLGLRGWGYLLEDKDVVATSKPAALGRAYEGWVRDYVESAPHVAQEFSEASIYGEMDYLAHEVRLPQRLRQQVGLYRFKRSIGTSFNDPCAIARAAPPWLSRRSLESIPLPVRVSNVFAKEGIKFVADLGRLTVDQLLHAPNFGRKSVQDLNVILEQTVKNGPDGDNSGQECGDNVSLLQG